MDKERGTSRDHKGNSMHSSTANASSASQRAKWASSSKFNKILSNLERSIKSQFSNSNQPAVGSSSSPAANKGVNSNIKPQKFNSSTSTSAPSSSSSATNSSLATNAAAAVVQQLSKRCNDKQQRVNNIIAQQQEVSTTTTASRDANLNKITLQQQHQQQKIETKARSTLNKYQQQIVSTMRPSQLIIQQNNFNNRLSIPPPHARNQNHQLLLGEVARLSYDTTESVTNASLCASVKSTTKAVRHLSSSNKSDVKQVEITAGKIAESRPSSSPASSAKSLPLVAKKQPGSQPLNKTSVANSTNNDDEEDSGFSTYQSLRSLIANNSSTAAIAASKGESQMTSNSTSNSNMILQAVNTQGITSMGLVNNFNAINSTPASQQFVYSFHHQQQHQLKPSQQAINTQQQQQLASSNQVPMMSLDPNGNNNSCYTNNNRLNQVTSSQRIINQGHQFSDFNQLYGFYGSNGVVVPINQSIESEQIYANAPPKPRRYQYYDSNQTNVSQMIKPQMAALPTKIASSSTTMGNGNNSFIQKQQPFHRGGFPTQINQQQQSRPMHLNQQPFYNGSYIQAQNLYQQGVLGNEGATNQLNNAYMNHHRQFQRQMNLPLLPPPPHQLTKSKSSLDARDLTQYRLNRELTGHVETNALHVKPSKQQLIYSSRFTDNMNCYPTSIRAAQQSSQFAHNNLQRSKSVTHLLPDYERHQMNQQARDWYLDSRNTATLGPKFLSVSSASTTNLNYAGLNGNNQQQGHQLQHQNQFPKIPSQLNISHKQQHDPTQQHHGNQLSLSTALRQQQQRINNWQNIQTPPNSNSDFNSQQQRTIINRNGTAAFSSNDRIVRQAAAVTNNFATEDSSNKQGLDDKIRYLLIGKDNELNSAPLKRNSASLIHHQKSSENASTSASIPQQAAWAANQSGISSQNELLADGILKCDTNGRSANASYDNSLQRILTSNQAYLNELDKLTNSTHINETDRMGNRQNHYQVNDKQLSDSPTRSSGDSARRKSDANSHLIVDLTTPRVLAKTQTNLVSTGGQEISQYRGDSWSINQVGLPQLSSTELNNAVKQRPNTNDMSSYQHQQQQQQLQHQSRDPSQTASLSTKDQNPICERSAPYYYSDLKSEEQRQALLSIVQQKSLSPPPQLLSRSTDHNNTRLALKSATLHSGQARMISENLALRQNRAVPQGNHKYSASNDFSSTSNITKNIDKLFESPVRPFDQKVNAVQSMLDLNDCKDTTDSSRMSSFQTPSESLSSGYCSSDMRNKNFSKSKSLENISQKSSSEHLVESDKMGNPVYENIRRSVKLMNAITTTGCLSTSNPRAERKSQGGSINSEESMDSILGSSLDDSDTSLDIIDEIKISSTDNHLTDISQLIQQLKSNHSKLADEYKSTLIRISKTMNDRNRDHKSEKLARRLQSLELKSKKYESRSKNQLALIQMMENVLKQSKLKDCSSNSNGAQQVAGSSAENSAISFSDNSSIDRSKINSSSCSPSYFQNHTNVQSSSPNRKNMPSPLCASKNANIPATSRVSPFEKKADSPLRSTPGVIKAIVTETKNPAAKFVAELKKSDEGSTSFGDLGGSKLKSAQNGASQFKSNAVSKKIINIENRNQRNPFSNNDDSSSCSSSSSVEQIATKQDGQHSNNTSHLMRDDEDFIEFLSTDGSSHRSSQFEASQFSASDFNTSTSASESSASNACNDSLSSPVISNSSTHNLFINGATGTGILKSSKSSSRDSPKCINNNSFESNNNKLGSHIDGDKESDNKFNSVLGNVIDVDICPLNNLSQCSPVNN